ncbi:hypothetical protein BT69DRAFT_1332199 [Atractiella rhizophila]|nr:hypothetical protein BT69DRAFT_1332199 [Atractiella rhizophila]
MNDGSDEEMEVDGDEMIVGESIELREEVEVITSIAEDEQTYHNPNPDEAPQPIGAVELTHVSPLCDIRDILMPLYDDNSKNLSSVPPTHPDDIPRLSDKRQLTLDEFRIWHRNNEKEASYEGHRQNWTLRKHEMHTLPEAKKMLAELSGLAGEWLPMCGASCSSYLDKYEKLDRQMSTFVQN